MSAANVCCTSIAYNAYNCNFKIAPETDNSTGRRVVVGAAIPNWTKEPIRRIRIVSHFCLWRETETLDCLVYCCFNNASSQHAKLDAPRAGLNPGKPESDVLLRRTLSDPDASGAANWTAGNFNSHVGSWCPCFPQREAGKGAREGEEGTQLSNSNGGPSNSIITTKSTSSLPTRGPPPTSNEGLQHSALLFAA